MRIKNFYNLTLTVVLAFSLSLTSCDSSSSDGEKSVEAESNFPAEDPAGSVGVELNRDVSACETLGLKLVNGEQCEVVSAAPGGTPLVRLLFEDAFGRSALCSGSAISPRVVLTAAHCFIDGVSEMSVETLFGNVGASEIIVHPNFSINEDISAVFNDVALVVTDVPMNVAPFAILVSREAIVGEEAIVSGFGFSPDDRDASFTLQAGKATVATVTPNHIFTEFTGEGSNPCQGDSGGPLLVRVGDGLAIAGIVSSGRADVPDCGVGDVTLYASIFNQDILTFITGNVPNVQAK